MLCGRLMIYVQDMIMAKHDSGVEVNQQMNTKKYNKIKVCRGGKMYGQIINE